MAAQIIDVTATAASSAAAEVSAEVLGCEVLGGGVNWRIIPLSPW